MFNSLLSKLKCNSKKTLLITLFILNTINFTFAQDNIFPVDFFTKAKHAYLMDYESGEILYSKNANVPMTPSSMTKIMTTYIMFSKLKQGNLNLSDNFIVSKNASLKGGSKMFLKHNQKVSVENLLKGVIVLSGNDASITLAEGLYGSEENFVERMNLEAKKMGLENTKFKNSTGWPDEGHVMSAKDLAILTKNIIEKFPEYYHYHSIKDFSFNKIKQTNRNSSLGSIGVDGVKTGRTDKGGYGIVLSAQKDDRRLIAIVNGLANEKERSEEAERLLNYGFINFKNITLFSGTKEVMQAEVRYGAYNQISLEVPSKIIITVPSEYDRVKDLVFLPKLRHEILDAPLIKGDVVGSLKITTKQDQLLIKEVDLIIAENVKKSGIIKGFIQWVKYFVTDYLK
ncbi:MAG: D-alanyl-D-alanine carboxypeptidase (penicillin-binding protein 5/6) [Candidatus Midichloriaceae bacterium]|jgi:D-alanyl-D-alanine carboxypeptidase (penicillin-binding protein 5/6)